MKTVLMAGTMRRVLALGVAATVALGASAQAQRKLPTRITNAELWSMMTSMSEPGGSFQSDNLTSNEMEFLTILDDLNRRTGRTGGAYVGVGPEQNFTYIAELKPAIVFQIDIRRQAVMQHLMYKALFELSGDRAEFVARLFSRPSPRKRRTNAPIDSLIIDVARQPMDSATFKRNLDQLLRQLTVTRALPLDSADRAAITYVYRAFYQLGPSINYNLGRIRSAVVDAGDFYSLMAATDAGGKQRSFLANEERFRVVKDLHSRNMIVPVVGNFAGPSAIRAIGAYLKDHGTTLNAFYFSNVEQYLFGPFDELTDPATADWPRFYRNLETLPFDSRTTIIRSIPPSPRGGSPLRMRLDNMADFLSAFAEGRIRLYANVMAR